MRMPVLALLLVATVVAGCGGNDNSGPASSSPNLITNIAIPNASSPPFSFDIGYAEAGRYYLADRNNKAVDVVDTKSNALLAQITGSFAGVGATTDVSGPDGIVGITGTNTLYVGDVDSVKVVDTNALKTIKTIAISNSGSRVDEGCYDPDDHLVMFASPGETPPYVTILSTTTQAVVSKLVFNGSSGLEACTYDSTTKNFYINNDGTTANPDGELDVIAASSVSSGTLKISKAFPLGKCSPTGLALGPNSDILVGCDPSAGNPLITLILDRNTGAQLASVPFGGVDQLTYDSASNRYFLPARHYVSSGTAAASGFSPQMAVIDGTTRQLLYKVAIGAGAHSVAVDGALGQVYVPFQPGSSTQFANGGISVFTTK
ncbi:hypothetical protein AWB75_03288 [Caballeronia catudaia]|uniref:DNA-binding beta-propeller fold protein YncE n=1 Tax=Caballeronia catudaia TaxID=1777136 RepID=A0A158BCS4_9BURK|nr:hypothetical protein [Caballeronia catudaia]SAK67871.1 hypothetical protein AWB75_03288 [Caballeronia catudaia]